MSMQTLTVIDSEELKKIIQDAVKQALNEKKEQTSELTSHVSRKEAAKILGVSLPTLNKYTTAGIVTAYRNGGRVRYMQQDLEACFKKIRTRS
jgi:excisionase family DNA binding protein